MIKETNKLPIDKLLNISLLRAVVATHGHIVIRLKMFNLYTTVVYNH